MICLAEANFSIQFYGASRKNWQPESFCEMLTHDTWSISSCHLLKSPSSSTTRPPFTNIFFLSFLYFARYNANITIDFYSSASGERCSSICFMVFDTVAGPVSRDQRPSVSLYSMRSTSPGGKHRKSICQYYLDCDLMQPIDRNSAWTRTGPGWGRPSAFGAGRSVQ